MNDQDTFTHKLGVTIGIFLLGLMTIILAVGGFKLIEWLLGL